MRLIMSLIMSLIMGLIMHPKLSCSSIRLMLTCSWKQPTKNAQPMLPSGCV